MLESKKVIVVGAGLAGSEVAYSLAESGVQVYLYESKVVKRNPAQKIDEFAELVCTNSLKSKAPASGHGLLKYEMKALNSLILKVGTEFAVPAGDALAVDRDKFSHGVTQILRSHSKVEVIDEIVDDPKALQKKHSADAVVIASGPLPGGGLEDWILKEVSGDDLYFYDAIAPVVDADSLDMDQLYFKNRYEENLENADYLNVPLNKEQYYEFVEDLTSAEKVQAQNFEDYKFFEGCLPIDIMAERGPDTLMFSCMKPVGLEHNGKRPYAVIQLRKENLLGSAFNLVGFQNRLKYGEQLRVFRKLPGFSNASFHHLGSVHRNTFLNAKAILNDDLSTKKFDDLYFAGQICGVEGYTESAAMGQYVAWQIKRKFLGKEMVSWPKETGIGALVNYIRTSGNPSPSNINFGLLPSVVLTKEQRRSKLRKKIKKELVSEIARNTFDKFMSEL